MIHAAKPGAQAKPVGLRAWTGDRNQPRQCPKQRTLRLPFFALSSCLSRGLRRFIAAAARLWTHQAAGAGEGAQQRHGGTRAGTEDGVSNVRACGGCRQSVATRSHSHNNRDAFAHPARATVCVAVRLARSCACRQTDGSAHGARIYKNASAEHSRRCNAAAHKYHHGNDCHTNIHPRRAAAQRVAQIQCGRGGARGSDVHGGHGDAAVARGALV